MKKRAILIVMALLLCACSLRTVRGSGRLVTESRDVRGFDRVSLSGSDEAIITQGDEESLTVETDRNVMRYITSEVRDGTLVLGTKIGAIVRPTRLRFTVSVKDLAGLTVSGSGDIVAERVDTDRLEIKTSGSGLVRVDTLRAEQVQVRISGTGDVELAGQVTAQEVTIVGSGEYRGGDLRSETSAVTIRGAGDATLWTTESLDARLTGRGSASYYGNPRTDVSSVGSGKLEGLGDK